MAVGEVLALVSRAVVGDPGTLPTEDEDLAVRSNRSGRIAVRPSVAELSETGVRFTDGVEEPFDDIILATGFTPALSPLGGRVRTDAKGFAQRTDRVTSADKPGLYFVGHSYDSTGGLYNIRRDSALAAERIARG